MVAEGQRIFQNKIDTSEDEFSHLKPEDGLGSSRRQEGPATLWCKRLAICHMLSKCAGEYSEKKGKFRGKDHHLDRINPNLVYVW